MPSHPSPSHLMAAFIARKQRILAALHDEGGLFELRFIRRLLDRIKQALGLAATESDEIDAAVAIIREQIKADLASTNATPGVLDDEEVVRLQRRLQSLAGKCTHHNRHLHTLSE